MVYGCHRCVFLDFQTWGYFVAFFFFFFALYFHLTCVAVKKCTLCNCYLLECVESYFMYKSMLKFRKMFRVCLQKVYILQWSSILFSFFIPPFLSSSHSFILPFSSFFFPFLFSFFFFLSFSSLGELCQSLSLNFSILNELLSAGSFNYWGWNCKISHNNCGLLHFLL